MVKPSRRDILLSSLSAGAVVVAAGGLTETFALSLSLRSATQMKLGLVTYQWGKDWDVPTLIGHCEKTNLLGVELRTTHKHGVEPSLNARQRLEVRQQFANSPVRLVGIGSNENFDNPDPGTLKKAIEATKEFIHLSHDVGGTGVKVKPNSFHKGVPREKTIEQIGRSLNLLAAYGQGYGQQIRLEVHGQCSPLPIIKQIMDIADHPNVAVCWNSNSQDLDGEGLEYNFNLVKDRFGDTVHIRELDIGSYPYQSLMNLFVQMSYTGWILLEARTTPKDRVQAMHGQYRVFSTMLANAQGQKSPRPKGGVKITKGKETVRVEFNNSLFTEYTYKDVERPFFYPIIGPTGDAIIRHWPVKDGVPHEEHDHRHHHSLWYTHGDVNGFDFWSAGKGNKIVHDKFLKIESHSNTGVIESTNKWIAKNGKTICTDTRTHKFYNRPEGKFMDFNITIHASHGPVTLGDTKEGSMAIRLAPTMRLKGKVGQGHIVNSEGHRDNDTWGKRAGWCDYHGPVNGKLVGVAIFDHSQNPKHPTWWHVRNYGLFAANPFGVHYFEKKPEGAGKITIPAGESLTWWYRIYIHKGDEKQAQVAKHYREYLKIQRPQ